MAGEDASSGSGPSSGIGPESGIPVASPDAFFPGSSYPSITSPAAAYDPYDAWFSSPERLQARGKSLVWLAGGVGCLLGGAAFLVVGVLHVAWTANSLTVLLTAVFMGSGFACLTRAFYIRTQAHVRFREREAAGQDGAGTPSSPSVSLPPQTPSRTDLQELIAVNRADMGGYQKITRDQARTSYRWSLLALGIGLATLVGGVALVLVANGTADKAAIAGLTGLSGALSSYVARTYLRIYERTLQQLNYYFQQPLVSSYMLAAERVVDGVTDPTQKTAALLKILDHTLAAAERPSTDEQNRAAIKERSQRRQRSTSTTPQAEDPATPASQPSS